MFVRHVVAAALVLLATASAAHAGGPRKPGLRVKIERGTRYTLTPPPGESELGSAVRFAVGRRPDRAAVRNGDEIYGGRPTKRVRATMHKLDGSVVTEDFTVPASAQRRTSIVRGPSGAALFVEPRYNATLEPVGIPLEQIAKVSYTWGMPPGIRYLGPSELPIAERAELPLAQRFVAYFNGMASPIPVSARIELKDGTAMSFDTIVGQPARARRAPRDRR